MDAVQAVGALEVDARALGVHFLAAGAHKWLLGMTGAGVLYVDPEAAAVVRPPLLGESNVAPDWRTWEENRTTGRPMLKRHARAAGFEAGTRHYAPQFALRQALGNLDACATPGCPGIRNIERRLRRHLRRLVEGLRRLDARVASPLGEEDGSGMLAFELPRRPAAETVAELARRGIAVALRKQRVRVSPHYYNNNDELDEFLAAVRACA